MNHIAFPIADISSVPGLQFRAYRGPEDLPLMMAAATASETCDEQDTSISIEGMVRNYTRTPTFDPARNVIVADVRGHIAGYARARWWPEINDGALIYESWGCLMPDYRRRGIGRTMLGWLEVRQREIATDHSNMRKKVLRGYASPPQVGWICLLDQHGYRPVRVSHTMVRATLDDLPEFPLPRGIELRPARPEHYRAIWEAARDAFADHWGAGEQTEEDYQDWLTDPLLMEPDLWQIAWDVATNRVAGQVRTFIDPKENLKYLRLRGYTEFVSVGRPWRGRGLARALISQSLIVQKARGMTQSALGVDSTNNSGANRVYTDCGFRVVATRTTYDKPL